MLRLHQLAGEEIREAAAWYDERSAGLGARFVDPVGEAFELLEANPGQFGQLETLSSELPIRRVLLRGFPFLIVFELFDAEIFAYAVAHASRRPNYWRRRKRESHG
jgi:toxin ParE1/3/4